MSITLVQTKGGGSGNYTGNFTFSPNSPLTAGNQFYVTVTAGNADVQPTVTDSLSNTYSMDKNTANPTSGARQTWLFRAPVTTGGTPTVTVNYSSGNPDSSWICREYSGLSTSPLDVTSANNDGSSYNTTHDAGTTSSTTQASELVILFGGCAVGSDPVLTAGTGYGNGIEQKGFDVYTYSFMSDAIISSTGAQSGNFMSTGYVQGQAGIATYKASGISATVMFPVISKVV